MDKSWVEPTIFFIEKISFSLKLFSGYFYGQSFIKTVRGPLLVGACGYLFQKMKILILLFLIMDLMLFVLKRIVSVKQLIIGYRISTKKHFQRNRFVNLKVYKGDLSM